MLDVIHKMFAMLERILRFIFYVRLLKGNV